MAYMFEVRAQEPDERDEKLAEFVARRIVDNWPPLRMAEHLGLAGLTFQQAQALVQWVAEERQDLLAKHRRTNAIIDLSLTGAAVVSPGLFFAGLAAAFDGAKLESKPTLLPGEEVAEDDTSKMN